MKSKVLQHSYVIGLIESGLPIHEIAMAWLPTVGKYLASDKNAILLNDWRLIFSFIYNNTGAVVLARKSRSNPIEKEKEVIIHIPIPSSDVVMWGAEQSQFITRSKQTQRNPRYTDTIEVAPEKFEDLVSYIIAVGTLAINAIFELGVTVNGKRIGGN